jgi:hypothetical protein
MDRDEDELAPSDVTPKKIKSKEAKPKSVKPKADRGRKNIAQVKSQDSL